MSLEHAGNIDEILELLKRERASPPAESEGYSVDELAERLHRSHGWVRQALRAIQRQGALVVGERACVSIDNRSMRTPVYMVDESKLAKAQAE